MAQQKQKRNDNRKAYYMEILEEMYCMLQEVTWEGKAEYRDTGLRV